VENLPKGGMPDHNRKRLIKKAIKSGKLVIVEYEDETDVKK